MRPRPPRVRHLQRPHVARVFGPPGQNLGDEERFDVECDLCGWLCSADSDEQARAIAEEHQRRMDEVIG